MAEVKQIVVKTNTGKKVKQLEERNKQLEEKVKQLEAEAVKGVQKGVEMVVSVVAEENERLKEQVKQLEEQNKQHVKTLTVWAEADEEFGNDKLEYMWKVTEENNRLKEQNKQLEEKYKQLFSWYQTEEDIGYETQEKLEKAEEKIEELEEKLSQFIEDEEGSEPN